MWHCSWYILFWVFIEEVVRTINMKDNETRSFLVISPAQSLDRTLIQASSYKPWAKVREPVCNCFCCWGGGINTTNTREKGALMMVEGRGHKKEAQILKSLGYCKSYTGNKKRNLSHYWSCKQRRKLLMISIDHLFNSLKWKQIKVWLKRLYLVDYASF